MGSNPHRKENDMTTRINISIPVELARMLEEHPEIKVSKVCQQALWNEIKEVAFQKWLDKAEDYVE